VRSPAILTRSISVLATSFLLLVGCSTPQFTPLQHANLSANWVAVDSLNRALPADVRVFAYSQEDPELRAWFTSIRPGEAAWPRVVVAADPRTHRATTSEIAEQNDACVAVNGGYFAMDEEPASHVGLLWIADSLHSEATRIDGRPGVDRPVRAALGIGRDGRPDVTWAGDSSGVLVRYQGGASNRWAVESAVGAGPMLLRNGEYAVTATEEGFARTSIPATHPRTAAGVTSDGRLVLMVVDGRQERSRGVNLAELADLMRSAGAVDAMNLDGGGSSTLVVNGHLVNRPTGGTFQRSVMSAIVVQCR
jgi:uncharacterized protein YigE (DUF2233 family)